MGVSQEAGRPIRFGTYNIQNVRNGGLEPALQGILQANIYQGVFQETEVTEWVYTR